MDSTHKQEKCLNSFEFFFLNQFEYQTMKFAIFFIFSLTFTCCQRVEVKKNPNFLFILVDDLGVNDLSFTGSSFYETPNIDSLATKGVFFSQGYSNSRVCSPSRASILTGKFTARHGITDWIGAKYGEDWRKLNREDKLLPASYLNHLRKEEITIAQHLKENGYSTFFAGKWHLGDGDSSPENFGFKINVGGWESGSPKGGYFSPFNNPKLKDIEVGENLSMRLAKETSTFIKNQNNQPFFAFLSFYAVHGPIQTTKENWKKYRAKAEAIGVSADGIVMEKKLPIRQSQDNPIYGGLVQSMDDAVGFVLSELKKSSLDKNTIVIFTSDNGGVSSGDSYSTSNLPYKGGKGYQYEGGIKVPYIIYIPWLKNKFVTVDYPVTGADLYPTIADFANIKLLRNQHKDGLSLKPLILENKLPKERPLFWHYPHYGNQGGDPSSIIRKGKWKLIHYYENNKNELYNLENDKFETNNVAEIEEEITSALYKELSDWLVDVNAKFPKKDLEFDSLQRKKYEERISTKLLSRLKENRINILQENYQPNKDWWGSQILKD